LALGVIGVAVLAFFPILDGIESEAEKARWSRRCNTVGIWLSILGVVFWIPTFFT
jgi:hypothetical protein